MAKFKKRQTIDVMLGTGIVPVFYDADPEVALDVLKACYAGGIRVFEFTNRGEMAHDVFRKLIVSANDICPDLILGVGTVLDAPTAALYIQLGANFVVGPNFNPEVARLCNRRGVPYSPGCGSVTEICDAMEYGCDIIKVFPAGNVGGPSFVKNVLAPLPWANLMVTGGVEPTEENIRAWAGSGVACVGMGSKLFPEKEVHDKAWEAISERCGDSLRIFRESKKLF